ncbi:hypothetical protein JVT61DRAFT_8781 [Boletus reticuloceps]|uniref:Uncharacterized protein n=1 Tax=Boletus reticuloceps TaxID=495285 RepID=A0A8I2YHX4_9AGAM|nr:hypothetical protein JVT61DRAFT_8781 [Boletus reticuloceps]
MTGASALMDAVALLLLQNIKESMETGRIANMDTVQTEVEAAIAELNRTRLLEGPTHLDDVAAKLLLEMGSLQEKVARCESQLAEFQSRADVLKEETTQIAARAEACNLLVEQQQKENVKVLAAMEGAEASISTAPPPFLVPAPSHTDPVSHLSPSKMAVISFPGGPRTVTIHPPDSPSYQSVIRDEKGDIIITFKGTKPLRREGAFRGPLSEVDLRQITHVYGRGPQLAGPRAAQPVPRRPDQPQPSSCPPPSRGPSDIIARQRQLSLSMQTDAFGRVLAPDYLINAKSPSLPTGMSSSAEPSPDSQSPLSAKPNIVITLASTPPSPILGRGKKRTRSSDEDEGMLSATERRNGTPLLIDPRTLKVPTTPTPVKREESQGPAKRKKRRSSAASSEALPAESGSGSSSQGLLDVTRTV